MSDRLLDENADFPRINDFWMQEEKTILDHLDTIPDLPAAAREKNFRGYHPLHLAAMNSSPPVVSRVLDAFPGAASVPNQYDQLPLHCAVLYDASPTVVSRLLDALPGAASSTLSWLPLHYAARETSTPPVINLLVAAHPQALLVKSGGEHIEWQLEFGKFPIDVAKNHNTGRPRHRELVALLEALTKVYRLSYGLNANWNGTTYSYRGLSDPRVEALLRQSHAWSGAATAPSKPPKTLVGAINEAVKAGATDAALAEARGKLAAQWLSCVNRLSNPGWFKSIDRNALAAAIDGAVKAGVSDAALAKARRKLGGKALRIADFWKQGEKTILDHLDTIPDLPAAAREKDGRGHHPLHLAAMHASPPVVSRVLDAFPGAASVPNQGSWLPLHYAVRETSTPPVINLLVAAHPQALLVKTMLVKDKRLMTGIAIDVAKNHNTGRPRHRELVALLEALTEVYQLSTAATVDGNALTAASDEAVKAGATDAALKATEREAEAEKKRKRKEEAEMEVQRLSNPGWFKSIDRNALAAAIDGAVKAGVSDAALAKARRKLGGKARSKLGTTGEGGAAVQPPRSTASPLGATEAIQELEPMHQLAVEPVPEAADEATVDEATVDEAVADMPPLVTIVSTLKIELHLEGNMTQVIAKACAQLGVSAEGKPVVQKARECYHALGVVV